MEIDTVTISAAAISGSVYAPNINNTKIGTKEMRNMDVDYDKGKGTIDAMMEMLLRKKAELDDMEKRWKSDGDFNEGDVITVEPWRSAGFPIIKYCMVDRSAFDKIIQAGGYTSIRTGQAQDANAILIPKENADEAMDCATCIGCGACVAACKNGSAMLFVSAKVSQLALLPQGKVEAARRAKAMLSKMDELGFGNCTNTRACEAECPKLVSISNIARLNREFIAAKLKD